MNSLSKTLLLTATALAITTSSLGDTTVPITPDTPEGFVIALTDEVELEYLPPVNVEIVHEEVEINGLQGS